MSSTGPMTCTTCPTAACFSAIVPSSDSRLLSPAGFSGWPTPHPASGGVRGAADNFDDLLGDRRLAHFVHVQGKGFDHFAGVLGGGFHGGHARGVVGSGRFQHGAEYLGLDIAREQVAEDLLLGLLVEVVD